MSELEALAKVERSPLDEQARARIRQRIRLEGPGIMRRARRVRVAVRAVGGAGSLALALLLAWQLREVGSAPEALRCQSFAGVEPSLQARPDESRAFGLARASWVLSPGSAAELTTLEPCRMVLSLAHGRVLVHARDLGGGELLVETSEGRVRVRGTRFAVEQGSSGMQVDVLEGRVEVERRGRATAELRGGQGLLPLADTPRPLEPSAEAAWSLAMAGPTSAEPIALEVEAPPADPGPPSPPDPPATSERRRRAIRRQAEHPRALSEPAPSAAPAAEESTAEPSGDEPSRPADGPAERRDTPLALPGPAPSSANAEELVREGDLAQRRGDLAEARLQYQRAGRLSGATAEAAWLALARMELKHGRAQAAQGALLERSGRFGRGQLGPEASWLSVETLTALGQRDKARAEAEELLSRWPDTPQAQAARRWLEAHR